MTKTGVLERQPFTIPDTPAELLAAARNAVGDGPRSAAVLRSDSTTLTTMAAALEQQRLPTLFAELGIEPFTEESVAAYQKIECDRVQHSTWRGRMYNRMPWLVEALHAISLTGGGALTFGGIIFSLLMMADPALRPLPRIVFAIGVPLLTAGIILQKFPRWRWVTRPYSVDIEMPDGVRAIAQRILEQRLPGVWLEVESLEKNPRVQAPDPFLTVRDGSSRHRVAVWREPNYQAHLE